MLRHDAFDAELAPLGEHRPLWLKSSLNTMPSTPLTSRSGAPRRASIGREAQIVAVETQKVEGHGRGPRSAALGQERPEVVPPWTARFDLNNLLLAIEGLRS